MSSCCAHGRCSGQYDRYNSHCTCDAGYTGARCETAPARPPPPPPPPAGGGSSNSCRYANDGECDDGSTGGTQYCGEHNRLYTTLIAVLHSSHDSAVFQPSVRTTRTAAAHPRAPTRAGTRMTMNATMGRLEARSIAHPARTRTIARAVAPRAPPTRTRMVTPARVTRASRSTLTEPRA